MSRPLLPLRTSYLPPILRLQPEVGGMFVDHMDLVTITRWRLTCKINYDQSASALRRTLQALLRRFVPFPTTLLNFVTRSRAIIGGEVALGFLLRDPSYTMNTLEIYASEFEFCGLCDAILADDHIQSRIESHSYKPSTHSFALRRLIADTLKISMSNGRMIYIHRSYTISPAAPLTRSPCTALSNFVTAYSFGCSHPLLTLQRRALLADRELCYLPELDADIMNNLLRQHFTMAVTPAAWSEYRPIDVDLAGADVASEPTHPRQHFSAFTGFVASGGDPDHHASPSAEAEFAYNVGLAQAVYDGLVVNADGLTGAAQADVATPSTGSPPLLAYALDHPFDTSHPVVPEDLPIPETLVSVTDPSLDTHARDASHSPSCHHADTVDRPRDMPVCDVVARRADGWEGSLEEASSPFLSSDATVDDPPPLVTAPPSPLASPQPDPVPALSSSDVDGTNTSTSDGSRSGDALGPLTEADTSDVEHAPAGGDLLGLHDTVSDGDVDSSAESEAGPSQDAPSGYEHPVGCWRHLYICPSQGRYFGDRGSFVDFFDPLAGGESACIDNNIAPYGSMVVWRIQSSFDCDDGCEYFDSVLEEGVTSIPVMFKHDPYGELRDIVSDRYMPVPRGAPSLRRIRSNSV